MAAEDTAPAGGITGSGRRERTRDLDAVDVQILAGPGGGGEHRAVCPRKVRGETAFRRQHPLEKDDTHRVRASRRRDTDLGPDGVKQTWSGRALHVADLDGFLGAAAGLIRPGGAMVASTLNRTLKSLALAKIGAEYVLRWLPVGTHDWRKFVRPSELAAGLKDNGVEITDLKGMTYAPIERDWRLSQNLDVNYLAFGVKR